MPKIATDYSKTLIYKIVCIDLNIKDCYVGHTTNFRQRKSLHKSICNNQNSKYYNNYKYKFIRENGGWENWDMVPLEEFPCENNIQARIREQYWINELQSGMNSWRAYRTEEERITQKKENNLKHRDRYQKASNLKYKTDALHRHKRLVVEKDRYQKKKDELLPQKKEDYKKKKDELNEKRRNISQEEKDKRNASNRWNAWIKKPYESILFQSFIQKLLK